MEDRVLSIEQMQELIDLGIDTSKASAWWVKNIEPDMGWDLWIHEPWHVTKTFVPTFTLEDILGMFKRFHLEYPKTEENLYFLTVVFDWGKYRVEEGATPLEAAFKMLKYIKKNNLM